MVVTRYLMVLFLILCSGASMAGEIEEPKWRLLDQLGEVEIRHYEPRIQAVTTLRSKKETSGGFRRLAGYIFGGNEQELSIAMTAPVQLTLQNDETLMAFNMPADFALEELPAPENDSISLTAVPARTVAALRFSGWATDGKVASRSAELMATLEENGIKTVDTPVLNQYNPPWTPPWKRRNEVVIAIDNSQTRL